MRGSRITSLARVLDRFNEEIIIGRCKLQPSCLIHDRCFTMVDNNLIKGKKDRFHLKKNFKNIFNQICLFESHSDEHFANDIYFFVL